MSRHFVDIRFGRMSDFAERQDEFLGCLSGDERERSRGIKRDIARDRYVISRGLLRQTLAEYVACAPAELQFAVGLHGKPFLSGHELYFNLSHSGDSLLLAVSDLQAIGVDIETVRDRDNLPGIAERSFSAAELAYWQALPEAERVSAFFRLWTIKEAFVKAVGRGIALGLASCEVDVAGFRGFSCIPQEYAPAVAWSVRELELAASAKAALVAPNSEFAIRELVF